MKHAGMGDPVGTLSLSPEATSSLSGFQPPTKRHHLPEPQDMIQSLDSTRMWL